MVCEIGGWRVGGVLLIGVGLQIGVGLDWDGSVASYNSLRHGRVIRCFLLPWSRHWGGVGGCGWDRFWLFILRSLDNKGVRCWVGTVVRGWLWDDGLLHSIQRLGSHWDIVHSG